MRIKGLITPLATAVMLSIAPLTVFALAPSCPDGKDTTNPLFEHAESFPPNNGQFLGSLENDGDTPRQISGPYLIPTQYFNDGYSLELIRQDIEDSGYAVCFYNIVDTATRLKAPGPILNTINKPS
jgi:hypothetical protein